MRKRHGYTKPTAASCKALHHEALQCCNKMSRALATIQLDLTVQHAALTLRWLILKRCCRMLMLRSTLRPARVVKRDTKASMMDNASCIAPRSPLAADVLQVCWKPYEMCTSSGFLCNCTGGLMHMSNSFGHACICIQGQTLKQ